MELGIISGPSPEVLLAKEEIFEAAKRSVCHLFGIYTYKEKEEKIHERLNDTCSKEKDSCKSREELKQKLHDGETEQEKKFVKDIGLKYYRLEKENELLDRFDAEKKEEAKKKNKKQNIFMYLNIMNHLNQKE